MSTEAVEIVILGRPYKVSCPLGQQDALRQAADQLTDKLIELRQRSKVSSNEQLAVMAALNFAMSSALKKRKITNTLRPWTSGSRCCNAPSKRP